MSGPGWHHAQGVLRTALWRHPWTIALLVAVIGFAGELMFYTSEEGAAALFGAAAGIAAYLAVLVLRRVHRTGLPSAPVGQRGRPLSH